jgi:hypothetical protein
VHTSDRNAFHNEGRRGALFLRASSNDNALYFAFHESLYKYDRRSGHFRSFDIEKSLIPFSMKKVSIFALYMQKWV